MSLNTAELWEGEVGADKNTVLSIWSLLLVTSVLTHLIVIPITLVATRLMVKLWAFSQVPLHVRIDSFVEFYVKI